MTNNLLSGPGGEAGFKL